MDENDNDISLDVTLNDSFLAGLTSTPISTKRTTRQRQQAGQPNALFKAPLAPAAPKVAKRSAPPPKAVAKKRKTDKPKLVCKDCGKQYVMMGSYKNHCRTHAILGNDILLILVTLVYNLFSLYFIL